MSQDLYFVFRERNRRILKIQNLKNTKKALFLKN